MMSCHEAREALVDSVFAEVDDREAARLNEHLRGCAACRDEESDLLRTRERLEQDAVPISPSLEARLRAAVGATAGKAPPESSRVPPARGRSAAPWQWLRRPVPVYAALAAVLVAALAVRFAPGFRPETRALRPVLLVQGNAPQFVSAGADETATWAVAAVARRPESPRPTERDSL